MATRSEQTHAEEQRKGPRDTKKNKRVNRSKPGARPSDRTPSKSHAASKAPYALEPERAGRPSRESTRKSANRAKPDTNLTLREERSKSSADTRFRKSSAGKTRVDGKPRGKNSGA